MTYLPRPSTEEVRAKYSYLTTVEPDLGGETGLDARARETEHRRAQRVHDRCLNQLRRRRGLVDTEVLPRLEVLDYGGGNGKLLRPFLAEGHNCYLIDYNPQPLPGIVRLCDEAATCRDDRLFDLIICSHVLEHVSEPGELVAFLAKRLRSEGLLYVEVPQEIWAGLRLEADPVTHINFFIPASLEYLLRRHGLRVLETKTEWATYGGAPTEVHWVLAAPQGQPASAEQRAAEQAGGDSPTAAPPDNAEVDPAGLIQLETLLHPPRRATLRRLRRPKNETPLG